MEEGRASAYSWNMRKLIARLILMLAVLSMPLGMAPASAAEHHSTAMASTMPHCPEPAPTNPAKGAIPACAMACASALPAADPARPERIALPDPPVATVAVQTLDGLHPETATPPPKLS
jgi:hypothetical protein